MPDGNVFDTIGPLYRLTYSGWSVINRSQLWILIGIFLTVLSLIVALR